MHKQQLLSPQGLGPHLEKGGLGVSLLLHGLGLLHFSKLPTGQTG